VIVHAYNLSTQNIEAEGSRVQASLGYLARPCLKQKKKATKQNENKRNTEKKLSRLEDQKLYKWIIPNNENKEKSTTLKQISFKEQKYFQIISSGDNAIV
jgi:hypothetical protein